MTPQTLYIINDEKRSGQLLLPFFQCFLLFYQSLIQYLDKLIISGRKECRVRHCCFRKNEILERTLSYVENF